jgi:hypothetical protein
VNHLLKHPNEAVDLGAVLDYKTGNYLFDDELYERIHNLAIAGKITPILADLANENELEELKQYFFNKGYNLAVLDLNNLFRDEYIGHDKYHKIIASLIELGSDQAILIVMNNYKKYACGQFQIYLGFTFENIKHWPSSLKLQNFFASLPDELNDLIDGKIYTGLEHPPLNFMTKK